MNLSILLAIFISLTSSSHGAKILTLMYHNSSSHHIWMSSLNYALAERGHEVTSVDIKVPAKTHPNIKTLLLEPAPKSRPAVIASRFRSFSADNAATRVKSFVANIIEECSTLYERSPYKNFTEPNFNETFDLVIVDYGCNPCTLALLHVLNYPPAIILHPFTYNPHCLLRMANTPIYQAVLNFYYFDEQPLGTWQRFENLANYLYDDYLYFNEIVPAVDAVVQKHLGEHVPSSRDFSDHVALVLVNLFDFEAHVPFPANVIPVGGLHLKPAKPLPGDLQEFLDSASNGAILVSFGITYSQETAVNFERRNAFVRVFSRLPQKIIWRQDKKNMEGIDVPANVKLVSWFPQDDVLGHPNTVLFLSHCGGLSTMEATYHGVPVLGIGMPFIADQMFNAEKLVTSGVGLKINIADVTEESFYQNISELLTNPKYRQAAQRIKSLLRDDPVKPLDKAVYWIERIAKHGQIPGIRLPSVKSVFPLPSQHIILLDIVLVTVAIVLSLIIVLIVFWYFAKTLLHFVVGPRDKRSCAKKTQ